MNKQANVRIAKILVSDKRKLSNKLQAVTLHKPSFRQERPL